MVNLNLLLMCSFFYSYKNHARFLWTTGLLVDEGWVPWDIQAKNAAPNIIVWKKACTKLQIRIPGLYRYN